MIDLFTIFSKGGLVLVWYINNGTQTVTTSVNSLIKSIVLQDKVGKGPFTFDKLALQYHMDNQFDLIYVVAYQRVLELGYMDKFLTSIELKFRDKYKNDLLERNFLGDFSSFVSEIDTVFTSVKNEFLIKPKKDMMTYQESYKSSKTLKSVTNENTKVNNNANIKKPSKKVEIIDSVVTNQLIDDNIEEKLFDEKLKLEKLARLAKCKPKKGKNGVAKLKPSPTDSPKTEVISVKAKGKENRKWDKTATGAEAAALNYSKMNDLDGNIEENLSLQDQLTAEDLVGLSNLKGRLQGQLADIDQEGSDESSSEEEVEEQTTAKTSSGKGQFGIIGKFQNWVTGLSNSSVLTEEQMKPVLENLKNDLIEKNVATEVAVQLCNNVGQSLVGQKIGTFERVASKVKKSLEDSCRQLLNCGRRVDILRDIIATNKTNRPYVITFCGVNGVGKSTNLAKITFWLVEQGFRVMIAACDTFRSGAVEQLRVHVQKLNYIHPPEQHNGLTMVHLYEKGYGKDAASVALSAITMARDNHYDVVMIDTSGRMQDNEPLMRSLAKLITVNQPDLVLFVGEALVGHEAVDQLVKFNKALQDYSQSDHPRTIDGIVLTKFDTIDDKVGAAISMTYILGQPIMFIGNGQTYADLRQLSAETVVKSLMK